MTQQGDLQDDAMGNVISSEGEQTNHRKQTLTNIDSYLTHNTHSNKVQIFQC